MVILKLIGETNLTAEKQVLNNRTVGWIKLLLDQGKSFKDINSILLKQGLIKKPISKQSLSKINTGKTHTDVLPIDKFFEKKINVIEATKQRWLDFLDKLKKSDLAYDAEIFAQFENDLEQFEKQAIFMLKYHQSYNETEKTDTLASIIQEFGLSGNIFGENVVSKFNWKKARETYVGSKIVSDDSKDHKFINETKVNWISVYVDNLKIWYIQIVNALNKTPPKKGDLVRLRSKKEWKDVMLGDFVQKKELLDGRISYYFKPSKNKITQTKNVSEETNWASDPFALSETNKSEGDER